MPTFVRYTGNGTQVTFPVSLPDGAPLRREHVQVYVAGSMRTHGTHYVFSSGLADVVFLAGNAPPSGQEVLIRRVTPSTASTRVVDFMPGSVVTSTQLDESQLNSLYVAQEVADRNRLVYDPITNVVNGQGVLVTNISLDMGTIP